MMGLFSKAAMTRKLHFGLPCLQTALFLLLALGACQKQVPRDFYVRAWVLASVRAFEKETPLRQELVPIYRQAGLSEEDWLRAEERWFDISISAEIDGRILEMIARRKDLTRGRYVRFRARAQARAQALCTSFEKEVARLGEQQGFSTQAWTTARDIWTGDGESEREMERRSARLATALRALPPDAYAELVAQARRNAQKQGTPVEKELKTLCQKKGVSDEDFDTADELWNLDTLMEEKINKLLK
jgi:hypothetical protein